MGDLANAVTPKKNAKVVVTVVAGTEQSRFLPDFRTMSFNVENAQILKLFGSEREGTGVNRVISVELGPQSKIQFEARERDDVRTWTIRSGAAGALGHRIVHNSVIERLSVCRLVEAMVAFA